LSSNYGLCSRTMWRPYLLTGPDGTSGTRDGGAVLLLAIGLSFAGGLPRASAADTRPATAAPISLTSAEIQQRLEQAISNPDLDDPARSKVRELYTQAAGALREAESHADRAAQFERQTADVTARTQEVRSRIAELKEPALPDGWDRKTPAELEGELAGAEAAMAESKRRLQELTLEPQRRIDRRATIATAKLDLQATLRELDEQTQQPPETRDPAEVRDAVAALVNGKAAAAWQELTAYDAELEWYDSSRPLLAAELERASREASVSEGLVVLWRNAVRDRHNADVARQAQEATAASASQRTIHPALTRLADENVAIVQARQRLTAELEKSREEAAGDKAALERIGRTAATMRAKVAGGTTRTIGLLLKREREHLPKLRTVRKRLAGLEEARSTAEPELADLEEQAADLDNVDAATHRLMASLALPADDRESKEIASSARELLARKREYLESLIADQTAWVNNLIEHQATLESLLSEAESYASFIDQRILWVPSHDPLSRKDVTRAWEALCWIVDPSKWWNAIRRLGDDLQRNPVTGGVPILLGLILVAGRRRSAARAVSVSATARKAQGTSITPTLQAVFWLLIAVIAWPWLLTAVSLRLARVDDPSTFCRALGMAFSRVSMVALAIESTRQLCRREGLGEGDLGWSAEATRLVRRNVTWLAAVWLPTAVVVPLAEWQEYNELWRGSLNRLMGLICLLVLSLFLGRLLHPKRGVFKARFAERPSGVLYHLRHVWYAVGIGTPLVFSGLGVFGYSYTVGRFLLDCILTTSFLLGLAVAKSVVLRWVLLVRRRLAMAQSRRRIQAHQAMATGEEGSVAARRATVEDEEVDLTSASEKTRRLVAITFSLIGIVGILLLWEEMVPALRMLNTMRPWPGAPISIANLILAAATATVAVMAVRSAPGLIEMIILSRLSLHSGERYAITALCRYAITIAGLTVTCGFLGIGWKQVQWLAAAVSVGLGFGLQEIFANFVSGLILLLERPMRVGDTVTVGTVTGVVTRIQIRATTIRDWDRKELIIPNKQFIAGEFVNWTLSDSVIRLVIPVGIAYGSDTAKAEQVLRRIAAEHPKVLGDPAPRVLFVRFADNSLDFEVQVFLSSADFLPQVRHELHTAIDQAFREAGIEIAFPQQDIHIRSAPEDLRAVQPGPGAGSATPPASKSVREMHSGGD